MTVHMAWLLLLLPIVVIWTLVVLVYDAARRGKPGWQLWGEGVLLIVAVAVLTLIAAGAIRN